MRDRQTILRYLVAALFIGAQGIRAAGRLEVKAAAEGREFFVGEPFTYRITVSGAEGTPTADVSAIRDFKVEDLGVRQNSRTSISLVNGRMRRVVDRSSILTYRLTAKRTGILTIPPLKVTDGQSFAKTVPVRVQIRKPRKTDDFRLRMQLSARECYVGEPVTATLAWYIGQNVKGFEFTVPAFDNPAFSVLEKQPDAGPSAELLRVKVNGTESVAAKGQGILDGKKYLTVTVSRVLIPVRAGKIDLEPATVLCNALAGYRKQTRNGPFGDSFFDNFFGQDRRGVYRKVVVPSDPQTLTVSELPEKGKPEPFYGHIGDFRLSADADPTDMNVGDPITLTIKVTGPEYLEKLKLPPLHRQQTLARDFKVPEKISSGEVSGNTKIFTQTIRATRPDITEIPPIELPCFDTAEGRYRVVKSNPIPITVKETKVVTLRDAEGLSPVKTGRTIKAWTRGIAHNYEDLSVLQNQRCGPDVWLDSNLWLFLLLAPPLSYLVLLGATVTARKRKSDPMAVRSRKAFAGFKRNIHKLRKDQAPDEAMVLSTVKEYLGDRLGITGGALTFDDVRSELKERKIPGELLTELNKLFRQCEEGRFAGGMPTEGAPKLTEKALETVKQIEKSLAPRRRNQRWKQKGLGTVAFLILPAAVFLGQPVTGASLKEAEISDLFSQAKQLFHEADSLSRSNPEEARQLFLKSAMHFESIVNDGKIHNGKLFYNIGNAYFRVENIGRAILYYRRAERYIPNDINLQQNLQYARSKRLDRIEETEKRRILETIFFWHYDVSTRTQAGIFGFCFVFLWVTASLRLFVRSGTLGWFLALLVLACTLLLGSLLAEMALLKHRKPAVILQDQVVARKGDSENYEKSFTEPLHAGTELLVLESRRNWMNVRLADGRTCWLPSKAVELVQPQ